MTPTAVILFDSDCGFCRWSLAALLGWDRGRHLRPAPIQGPEGERLLADLGRAERLRSWHLVTPSGRRYSGGAVLPPLLELLPAGRPLARLAARFPRQLELGYRAIAEHRPILSRVVPAAAKRRADARIRERGSLPSSTAGSCSLPRARGAFVRAERG